MTKQQDQGPEFTLAELVPGEVALCLREGDQLHVIQEHMTPQEAVQMFKDIVTGKISQDELAKREWQTVSIREAQFQGAERIQVPPVQDWPK
jgi:hypothetical protein